MKYIVAALVLIIGFMIYWPTQTPRDYGCYSLFTRPTWHKLDTEWLKEYDKYGKFHRPFGSLAVRG